jgi:hypothetical protein
MYALYAVTTKANRSSARLLKNNRKTFSSRGKRFFSAWKRGEVMKKKVLEVSAVSASFFLFEPILSASSGGRSAEYQGIGDVSS